MERYRAKVQALASYLPEKVLTNHDLEKTVDTSDEWIFSRTGIKERRIAAKDETAATMGVKALKKLLEKTSLSPEEIDLIIVPTSTPDMIFPATACLIQHEIGATNAGGFDLSAACSGYVYALDTASVFVETGMYKNVVIVATEKYSSILDWEDRGTCVLFGDGASATLVSRSDDESGVMAMYAGGDGTKVSQLYIPAGGSRTPVSVETVDEKLSKVKMHGSEVFKTAVVKFKESIDKVLEKTSLTKDDIKLIVPHQANIRIIKALAKEMEMDGDKFYANIHKYGNTSAASIGIALDEALAEERFSKGDNIIITSFGAGFSWGATLIRW